ncbi:zinc finger protein 721 [Danaus plexippus]|uniref:zinc finger protein 721 n=1 Tax=Danaus plexippus TaxID=13037 RepID=UPI002AB236DB|nr:zinc finger protein 721 [Danaus plexippus]
MSADAASLPCPICLHTGVFDTPQSLKDRLIYVSTNKIPCPVCQEELVGLDKLTIHLFSHVKMLQTEVPALQQHTKIKNTPSQKNSTTTDQQKKIKASVSKNKTLSLANTQVKYVKIYPKLPVIAINAMPILDISKSQEKNNSSLTHVNNEKNVMQNSNRCSICGLHFVDADILKMHKCLIHNVDDHSNNSLSQYNCHLCSKTFKMRGSLMVHLRVAHYGFTSSDHSESNLNNEIKEKIEIHLKDKPHNDDRHDGKQWQCDVCRKSFTTKYFLKKHKRLHTGETPYACNQCNKTFTFQQSYHKHLLYHNDEKPHTCTFCGRAFKELSTLHNHQRIHTGEKPFACETCGKCFRQRVSYLVHRRIHTGAMPYKCTACEKSFRYKVSQRTHKCQNQPPGTVVRKTVNLVEKLKKKQTLEDSYEKGTILDEKNPIYSNKKYPEVSEVNAELVLTGAQLSLEDMESDNFTIITDDFNQNRPVCTSVVPSEEKHMETFPNNIDELIESIPLNDKSIPSPSEILKNLCLSNDHDFISDNC